MLQNQQIASCFHWKAWEDAAFQPSSQGPNNQPPSFPLKNPEATKVPPGTQPPRHRGHQPKPVRSLVLNGISTDFVEESGVFSLTMRLQGLCHAVPWEDVLVGFSKNQLERSVRHLLSHLLRKNSLNVDFGDPLLNM